MRERGSMKCVIARLFQVIMMHVGVLRIKNVFGHLADGHRSETFKVTLSSTVPLLFFPPFVITTFSHDLVELLL
jgi:hypothetical protein